MLFRSILLILNWILTEKGWMGVFLSVTVFESYHALQIFGFFYWSEDQLMGESVGYGSAQRNNGNIAASF
jgi:hypothetical protein